MAGSFEGSLEASDNSGQHKLSKELSSNFQLNHNLSVNLNNSPASKTTFFRVCWWNGGGKIRTRLRVNPELKKLLNTNPDVFTYGEAETPSPKNLDIENYICYLHSSKIDSTANFRRGLAIFYLEKYRYSFTKVYACRKYDIVWMRLKTACEIIHFCFFMHQVPITPFRHVPNFVIIFRHNSQNLLHLVRFTL